MKTTDKRYAEYLLKNERIWWKRLFCIQTVFGWNVRRLNMGFTLDIGAGLGRNLRHLGGKGVGIDSNPDCVEAARKNGLNCMSPSEFALSPWNKQGRFDTILLSHVAEHLGANATAELLKSYLSVLKTDGRLVLMTPQEAGFKTDPETHIEYIDFKKIGDIVDRLGFRVIREYSFPLPRIFGKIFYFNEFVSVSVRKCG